MFLKIVKFQVCEKYLNCSQPLIKSSYRIFEVRFRLSVFFLHMFLPKIAFFRQNCLKTFLNLRLEERSFVTIIIFCSFSPRTLTLIFQNFQINLLINSDPMAVDTFWGEIWHQSIFLVNIIENDEHRRTLLITTYPPIHPPIHTPIRTMKVFEVSKKAHPRLCLKVQFWYLSYI